MWIRSQDEKMLGDYIVFECYPTGDDNYDIWGYSNAKSNVLARYSTEAKALKVLDWIEEALTIPNCVIYGMPLDSEVKE